MLEQILKLYTMAMAFDVRSPMPHLVGPPGSGKSTVIETATKLIGVDLHILNVSRLSPLEVEGVQMPHGTGEEMLLRMLPATFWTSLKKGDILLLDEFLRGFPEVYNALLDILTARRVGAYVLPQVFIIGASNSTVAYDKALEDRLLHLPVPDPRKSKAVRTQLATFIVEGLGLLPSMVQSMEMESLLSVEVLPMYEILDTFKNGTSSHTQLRGQSVRKLIGMAQLREVQSPQLEQLILKNNNDAMREGKIQHVLLLRGKDAQMWPTYQSKATVVKGSSTLLSKLDEVNKMNLELNLQLIEMESIRNEKEGTTPDDELIDDIFT
jgi:hypothetical protein